MRCYLTEIYDYFQNKINNTTQLKKKTAHTHRVNGLLEASIVV